MVTPVRAFHFVAAEFGLEDLQRRRLKIATVNDLNDPFELLPVNLADPELRRAFLAVKQQLAQGRGMLCFSRRWNNPVQWSHYSSIKCPSLAIYADHLYDLNVRDPSIRASLTTFEDKYWKPFQVKSIARVRHELVGVQIAHVPGAHPSFILTHRRDVMNAILHFLIKSPSGGAP